MNELPVIQQSQCQCGHENDDAPVLDVRQIPHLIRHGAVLGSLRQLRPGSAFVLVAHHDPKPLLAQISDEFGSAVQFEYVESGPEAWKIKMTKA